MPSDQPHSRLRHDAGPSRERRVSVLKYLVRHQAYEVPAEAVAASIIRGVVAPGPAAPARPH